ncbi:transcriptional regulator [Citrobacter amalonaticus]|uniref:transcriptional regulator n=1 Tax=Citrobacter amalonaticus TaxID=35703 RepID=UPI00224DA75D|nr:YdaS family helix-turn-helix protein [Citrobacter amalonaticus]ELN9501817.1 helix-turn-helix domain-containing protein [Citrobacter amalonaticus]ELW9350736.1 helix-turn-helix domain-containing protein [Citrobacter amalonaticus]MCX3397313.1 helix-turn-helix domain-containing protein [Citrobacter amalonaticus]MDQ2176581.1 YdaS family helix-turn-helix protein [Citrobacter amalonaticus]WQJ85287.1 YdaS family helix-turn-helix protein [Citrobacter amalonaticus]
MDIQLKKKISDSMSRVSIGNHIGVSSQAVSKWMNKGKIPQKRIIALCQVLNWQVTPHEIDPIAYPNPTDGLPGQQD